MYKNCKLERRYIMDSLPLGSFNSELETETICVGNHKRKNERCIIKDIKLGRKLRPYDVMEYH